MHKFKKYTILSIFLLYVAINFPKLSYGGVIFEDNFDNYNWSSTSAYGTSVDGPMPFNLSRDTSKAGWFKYRHSATANLVGDPVFAVTAEQKHGAAGNSVKYEVENTYTDWNGGGVTLYLGSADNTTSGQTELYISIWVKFENSFVVPYLTNGYYFKFYRIYLGANPDLYGDDLTSEYGPNSSGSITSGCSRLETFTRLRGNGYMRGEWSQWPDYRNCPRGSWADIANPLSNNITNYTQWNRIMTHIKLNTAGKSDGLIEGYINDTLVATISNISLVNTATEGAIANNRINAITVPDNYFKLAAGMPANSEVAVYVDDLVVSTTYVPLNYVPGGGSYAGGAPDSIPPAAPTWK